jgi:hypothetical protein
MEGLIMNESAFPWSINDGEVIKGNKGMTLRDYFAAKAMQTLVEKYSHNGDVARNAYNIADAMLKAREA